jgi:hypothetical protein
MARWRELRNNAFETELPWKHGEDDGQTPPPLTEQTGQELQLAIVNRKLPFAAKIPTVFEKSDALAGDRASISPASSW